MKRVRHPLSYLVLAFAVTLAMQAQAQPGPGGGRFVRDRPAGMQRDLPQRRDLGERRANDRAIDRSNDRAAERGERSGGDERRRFLTPEERQQLRRDIHDAGRDIYRPERGPGRIPLRRPGPQSPP